MQTRIIDVQNIFCLYLYQFLFNQEKAMLLNRLFAPKSTSVSVFRSIGFVCFLSFTVYASLTIVYAFIKADVSTESSVLYEASHGCLSEHRYDHDSRWTYYRDTDPQYAQRICDAPGKRQPSSALYLLFFACMVGCLGTFGVGLDASNQKEVIVRLGELVWRRDATGKVRHMPVGAYRDEDIMGELFVLDASNEKALRLEFNDTGQRALEASLSLAFKPLPASCGSPDCAADDNIIRRILRRGLPTRGGFCAVQLAEAIG